MFCDSIGWQSGGFSYCLVRRPSWARGSQVALLASLAAGAPQLFSGRPLILLRRGRKLQEPSRHRFWNHTPPLLPDCVGQPGFTVEKQMPRLDGRRGSILDTAKLYRHGKCDSLWTKLWTIIKNNLSLLSAAVWI